MPPPARELAQGFVGRACEGQNAPGYCPLRRNEPTEAPALVRSPARKRSRDGEVVKSCALSGCVPRGAGDEVEPRDVVGAESGSVTP